MPEKKTFKMPKTLGLCADRLYTVRQTRLKENQAIEAFKSEESQLKEHIINELPKSQMSGVAGKLARVSVETKQVPTVEDWDKLYDYIKKSGNFQLLNRALNVAAAIEILEETKKKIPGVAMFGAVTVSVNKV